MSNIPVKDRAGQISSDWRRRPATLHQSLETLLVLLAPAAPHIAEELWQLTGHMVSVHLHPWPEWDDDLGRDEVVQIAVQVNGKVRATVELPVERPRRRC